MATATGAVRIRQPVLPIAICLATVAICAGCGDAQSSGRFRDQGGIDTAPIVEIVPLPLPPIGVAVADSGPSWCAEFALDTTVSPLGPGRRVAIVFPGPAPVAELDARLVAAAPGECPTAFPQPRWIDYVAYRLEVPGAATAAPGLPTVGLAVASDDRWERGTDGLIRADLDGDGSPEEAQRCLAGEGEHLTIWSARPDGSRDRRIHEYFDWGAAVDPTCGPGEDGRDSSGG